jgi:hypothetical protein
VNPEQIDVVGFESPKAFFDRTDEILSMVARGVQVFMIHRKRVLGRHDHLVSTSFEPPADDLFGLTAVILVRGIEEIPACIGVGIQDAVARGFVRPKAPLIAEAHRTEADF